MRKCAPIRFICKVFLFSLISFGATAQVARVSDIPWKNLMEGVYYAEVDAPDKSVVNDSKLTILKIDTRQLEFQFLTASEHGRRMRAAPDWAAEFGQHIIVNAGMYNYNRSHTNKGYMKNYNHLNNPHKTLNNNVMLAMHPKDKTKPPFEIYDITCQKWDSIRHLYHSFCQGMRMISCEGEAMAFSKRPDQSCSMVVAATDTLRNLYLVFTRSPYTHRTMIGYLQQLLPGIRTTVYLEGGPEASLYINTGDTVITKYGSYISNTRANDDNDHFWEIPNVIGIRKKQTQDTSIKTQEGSRVAR
ncbi:MAG: phosphodiester glycosidase family protein [Prolixibacteraceae bacterium]